MSESAVVAEGLTRTFGNVTAVDEISFEVKQGEIYGFLGPNGAGKSTTVKMLTTLLAPTSGRATVTGRDVVSDAGQVRLNIGAALQEAALDDRQTGRELLRLQGRLYGLKSSEIDSRMTDLSTLVDIGDAMDRRIGTYSGGMKRRLDLAASLLHNPEVLFLDEPTTGLDPVSRQRVWDEVRKINSEFGVTIFLTTQYLEEADALANRVGIINQGKIAVEGSPRELKRSIGSDVILAQVDGDPQLAVSAVEAVDRVDGVTVHDSEVAVSVRDGAEVISDVVMAFNQPGVTVREITMRSPTLDDVFLKVTGEHIVQDSSVEEDEG